MEWKQLGPTNDPDIRHCDSCNKNVYLCKTQSEFVENGNAGRCVAVNPENALLDHDELVGMVCTDYLREQETRRLSWWKPLLKLHLCFNLAELDLVPTIY